MRFLEHGVDAAKVQVEGSRARKFQGGEGLGVSVQAVAAKRAEGCRLDTAMRAGENEHLLSVAGCSLSMRKGCRT